MTPENAAWRLRLYFRDKAQHGDDCMCECCEAVEVLRLMVRQRGSQFKVLGESRAEFLEKRNLEQRRR